MTLSFDKEDIEKILKDISKGNNSKMCERIYTCHKDERFKTCENCLASYYLQLFKDEDYEELVRILNEVKLDE